MSRADTPVPGLPHHRILLLHEELEVAARERPRAVACSRLDGCRPLPNMALPFEVSGPSLVTHPRHWSAPNAIKALVQQARLEGLLVPDDFRLWNRIIVAAATGNFAELVGEQIGTVRVRR